MEDIGEEAVDEDPLYRPYTWNVSPPAITKQRARMALKRHCTTAALTPSTVDHEYLTFAGVRRGVRAGVDGNIDQYRPAAPIDAIPERTNQLIDLTDRAGEDLIEQYRTYLTEDEPNSHSVQQAILAVLRELRRVDEASTGKLQSVAYEDVEEADASPRTLWDTIGLTFTDLPGIADEGG